MTEKKNRWDTGLVPEYEDKLPVANKITIAPQTEFERTVLLKRPTGKENRRLMARVYPLLAQFQDIATRVSEAGEVQQNLIFAQAIGTLWENDEFEDVILPFVLQVDTEYLDLLELQDVIAPFLKSSQYLSTRENTKELQDALKKSQGEASQEEEATTA